MIDVPFRKFARGKLLLTGEYFVLDGALALALPTVHGQELTVKESEGDDGLLVWRSYDQSGWPWYKASFNLFPNCQVVGSSDGKTTTNLLSLLQQGLSLRQQTTAPPAIRIETRLGFPAEWGLGSSSTLISLLADWLKVNPYELSEKSFGGSGYDIACANAAGPIFYRLTVNDREVERLALNWPFKQDILFVYLGQKQDSRKGIAKYRSVNRPDKELTIQRINEISRLIALAGDKMEFISLINEHETLISNYLGLAKVKDTYFESFKGCVKSLGAWGGDFFMALGESGAAESKKYFESRGWDTILTWEEMIFES